MTSRDPTPIANVIATCRVTSGNNRHLRSNYVHTPLTQSEDVDMIAQSIRQELTTPWVAKSTASARKLEQCAKVQHVVVLARCAANHSIMVTFVCSGGETDCQLRHMESCRQLMQGASKFDDVAPVGHETPLVLPVDEPSETAPARTHSSLLPEYIKPDRDGHLVEDEMLGMDCAPPPSPHMSHETIHESCRG